MFSICVFTGTRAEYGLLRPLIVALQSSPQYRVDVLVSGSHLSADFGNTQQEVEADHILNVHKVDVLLASNSDVGICKSVGLGLICYGDFLATYRPDLVIGLGDRYELLAFVTAALLLRIPVCHLHGGESTEGAFDDAIRHAISKMSQYHFVSTEAYRRRVIQMGEAPERVEFVGALGIDSLLGLSFPSRSSLAVDIPILNQFERVLLVTLHPETLSRLSVDTQAGALIGALGQFSDYAIIATGANSDPDGRRINELFKDFASQRENVHYASSLGITRYLGVMKLASAVVGNSSSGILEAPAMGVPSVDIGNRQGGRIRAATVFEAPFSELEIATAIRRAVATPPVEQPLDGNPYWNGGAVSRILSSIERISSNPEHNKRFHDLPLEPNPHTGA